MDAYVELSKMSNTSFAYVPICCATPDRRYYPAAVELKDTGGLSVRSDWWFILRLLQYRGSRDGQAERISEVCIDYSACYALKIYVEVLRDEESVLHEPLYLDNYLEDRSNKTCMRKLTCKQCNIIILYHRRSVSLKCLRFDFYATIYVRTTLFQPRTQQSGPRSISTRRISDG